MICPVCGEAIPDDAVFCGKCGADLRGNQQSMAGQPQMGQQSSVSQQSTAASGQQMNYQQTPPIAQPQTGAADKTKGNADYPGIWIRVALGIIPLILQLLVSFAGS